MHIERQVREKQLNVFSPQFRAFQRKEMCPMCQVPLLSINPLLQLLVKLFFYEYFRNNTELCTKCLRNVLLLNLYPVRLWFSNLCPQQNLAGYPRWAAESFIRICTTLSQQRVTAGRQVLQRILSIIQSPVEAIQLNQQCHQCYLNP